MPWLRVGEVRGKFMSESVIVAARRTPIGKFQGQLASIPSPELGALALRAALDEVSLAPGVIDEVIFGNVLGAGVGQAPARQAALRAGLPDSVAALTINKVCGSGLKAVMLADQAIRAGDVAAVVAGGFESMSRAPYLIERTSPPLGDRTLIDSLMHEGLTCALSRQSMGQIAEALARNRQISREDLDAFAFQSHQRAVSAMASGQFGAEMVPVTVSVRGASQVVTQDEGPRSDVSLERLSKLRPAFAEAGCITAGNASMISDGAAALVVTSTAFQQQHDLPVLARITASATAGLAPEDLFVAPVLAIQKAVSRAGLTLEDIDLFEINEAFAVQVLACVRDLGLPLDRVNVQGGAIALGHPLGCSGARVAVTLVHALAQRQLRRGVAALCLGGGNAVAAVFERPGS